MFHAVTTYIIPCILVVRPPNLEKIVKPRGGLFKHDSTGMWCPKDGMRWRSNSPWGVNGLCLHSKSLQPNERLAEIDVIPVGFQRCESCLTVTTSA